MFTFIFSLPQVLILILLLYFLLGNEVSVEKMPVVWLEDYLTYSFLLTENHLVKF